MFIIERITGAKTEKGKQKYNIKWAGYTNPTWEPETNIPPNVVQEYLHTHTKQGKKRKQKSSKYFKRNS